jgi:hypothetical protein
MPTRWEGDNRGAGIGDAAQLVPGASELVAAFSEAAWVAERPDLHLRPHVDAWCERDPRVSLNDAYTDDRHAYVLDLQWHGAPASVGEARATVFSLVGSFAETATYIRQRRVRGAAPDAPQTLRFEVGTGELASDARFAPHGHVVVINVAGVLQRATTS